MRALGSGSLFFQLIPFQSSQVMCSICCMVRSFFVILEKVVSFDAARFAVVAWKEKRNEIC